MAEPDAGAGVGDDGALSVGARVQLHSLLRAPEHNGAEGEVVEFDASTGRWRVRLAGPDGRELALRASNLAVLMPASQTLLALGEMPCGADVEMHSLVRSPELNGGRGKVVEPQDPGTGRCGVKIDSDGHRGRVLALKPANLVRLCGNAACRQALAPPLLQCSKCEAKAYCCQACQVGDPATHRAPCARARVCSLTRTRSRPPCRLSLPPDRRVEGRAQARVRRAGPRPGRGGRAAQGRCAGGRARRCRTAEAPGGEVK